MVEEIEVGVEVEETKKRPQPVNGKQFRYKSTN